VSLALILDTMGAQIRALMEAESPWDVQVHPRMLVNPTPPAIDLYPADPSRDSETGGFGISAEDIAEGYWVNARARVSTGESDSAQDVLIALKDDGSSMCLTRALEADPTLAGYANDIALDNESGFVLFPTIDGSAVHIGVLWRFLVIPAVS
jgi:hypothetical protein